MKSGIVKVIQRSPPDFYQKQSNKIESAVCEMKEQLLIFLFVIKKSIRWVRCGPWNDNRNQSIMVIFRERISPLKSRFEKD